MINTTYALFICIQFKTKFVAINNHIIMKQLFILCLVCAFYANESHSQIGTTPKDFNLPDNTLGCQTKEFYYNGETKELRPYSQEVLIFKNGKLSQNNKMKADQTYSYKLNNEYNTEGRLSKSSTDIFDNGKTTSRILTYQYIKEKDFIAVYESFDTKKIKTEDRKYDSSGNLV